MPLRYVLFFVFDVVKYGNAFAKSWSEPAWFNHIGGGRDGLKN